MSATCFSSSVGEDVVPMLLDCLHPSVFSTDAATVAAVQRCFAIVLKLLSNHCHSPTEARYASFSAVGTTWQTNVLPYVYVLRLVEWMRCEPNAEGTRYIFRSAAHVNTQQQEEQGEEKAAASTRLWTEMWHCMAELRCVMAVWSAPIASLTTARREVPPGEEEEEESVCSIPAARDALRSLFHAAMAAATTSTPYGSCVLRVTRALVLRQLQLASEALSDGASIARCLSLQGATPTAHDHSELKRGGGEEAGVLSQPHQHTTALPDARREADANAELLARHLANPPVRWLLSHLSLCDLIAECNSAAAAAAAGSSSFSFSSFVNPDVPGTITTTTSHTHPSGRRSPLAAPPSAAAMAQRFRQQAAQEQHARYLNSTGAAYRRLTQEERHRGESVVIDIAGVLEQLAAVTETQGMVRVDRQEARRLLEAFRRDGDLVRLHSLLDQYTEELEEAKRQYGKPLVYAEYE